MLTESARLKPIDQFSSTIRKSMRDMSIASIRRQLMCLDTNSNATVNVDPTLELNKDVVDFAVLSNYFSSSQVHLETDLQYLFLQKITTCQYFTDDMVAATFNMLNRPYTNKAIFKDSYVQSIVGRIVAGVTQTNNLNIYLCCWLFVALIEANYDPTLYEDIKKIAYIAAYLLEGSSIVLLEFITCVYKVSNDFSMPKQILIPKESQKMKEVYTSSEYHLRYCLIVRSYLETTEMKAFAIIPLLSLFKERLASEQISQVCKTDYLQTLKCAFESAERNDYLMPSLVTSGLLEYISLRIQVGAIIQRLIGVEIVSKVLYNCCTTEQLRDFCYHDPLFSLMLYVMELMDFEGLSAMLQVISRLIEESGLHNRSCESMLLHYLNKLLKSNNRRVSYAVELFCDEYYRDRMMS